MDVNDLKLPLEKSSVLVAPDVDKKRKRFYTYENYFTNQNLSSILTPIQSKSVAFGRTIGVSTDPGQKAFTEKLSSNVVYDGAIAALSDGLAVDDSIFDFLEETNMRASEIASEKTERISFAPILKLLIDIYSKINLEFSDDVQNTVKENVKKLYPEKQHELVTTMFFHMIRKIASRQGELFYDMIQNRILNREKFVSALKSLYFHQRIAYESLLNSSKRQRLLMERENIKSKTDALQLEISTNAQEKKRQQQYKNLYAKSEQARKLVFTTFARSQNRSSADIMKNGVNVSNWKAVEILSSTIDTNAELELQPSATEIIPTVTPIKQSTVPKLPLFSTPSLISTPLFSTPLHSTTVPTANPLGLMESNKVLEPMASNLRDLRVSSRSSRDFTLTPSTDPRDFTFTPSQLNQLNQTSSRDYTLTPAKTLRLTDPRDFTLTRTPRDFENVQEVQQTATLSSELDKTNTRAEPSSVKSRALSSYDQHFIPNLKNFGFFNVLQTLLPPYQSTIQKPDVALRQFDEIGTKHLEQSDDANGVTPASTVDMMTELKAEFDELDENGVTPASIVYMMTELGVTPENISDESTKQRILNELNELYEAGYENAEANFYYSLTKDLAAGLILFYGGHVTQKELYKHVGPGLPRTFFTIALYGVQYYAYSMLMANEALQYTKSIYNTIAAAAVTFNYFKMLHEVPAGVNVPTVLTMAAAASNLPQVTQDASLGVQGRDSLLATGDADTPSKRRMEEGGSPFTSPFKEFNSPTKNGSPIRPMSSFSDTIPDIVVNPQTPAKPNQVIAPRPPDEQKKIDEFSLNLGKMINRVFGKKENPKTVPLWSDLYDEKTTKKIQIVFNTIQNLGSVAAKIPDQKKDMMRNIEFILNIDPKKRNSVYIAQDAPKFLRALVALQSSNFTYGKEVTENIKNQLTSDLIDMLIEKAPKTV
jgi:hypothetical protein